MARRRRLPPRKSAVRKRAQPSPVPKEAFTQHAGRWIALKGRKVVADADDRQSLVDRDDVDADTTTFYVPNRDELF